MKKRVQPRVMKQNLNDQVRELITAIATLKLLAAKSDGEVDQIELKVLVANLERRFLLTRRSAAKVLKDSSRLVDRADESELKPVLIDILNKHLDSEQKRRLLDDLAELITCDMKVHEREAAFHSNLAGELAIR